MKKLIVLLALLIVFTGCEVKEITNSDIDRVIEETTSLKSQKANKYFEGYKYYLPQGFSIVNRKGNNHVLLSNDDYFYLYVDIVSYFNKVQKNATNDNELYFFKKISYNNIDGYIKIGNPENDIYYIELSYNYSKIEAYVKKENLESAIKNSIRILASIQYNDVILETLIGDKTLDNKEEVYSEFESKREDGTFLDYIEEYYEYDDEEENNKDEDILDADGV